MSTFTIDHINGIALENPVAQFCKHKLKLADKVDHNNFSPNIYPNDNHLIVDVKVRDKALIECTNPKPTTFMNDEIIGNKFDYFHRADPEHKLLWIFIISFIDCISSKMKELAKKLRIQIVSLGFHAEQFGAVIKRLFKSALYHLLKSKVKPNPHNQFLHTYQTTLTPVSNNPNTTVNNRQSISKQCLRQHAEYCKTNEELIKNERLRECERLRMLHGNG